MDVADTSQPCDDISAIAHTVSIDVSFSSTGKMIVVHTVEGPEIVNLVSFLSSLIPASQIFADKAAIQRLTP